MPTADPLVIYLIYTYSGLSLRAGGRGFPLATTYGTSVSPGNFDHEESVKKKRKGREGRRVREELKK